MFIKPLGKRVLIKPITMKYKHSALVIPEEFNKELNWIGEIVKTGECTELKVGDKVIFSKYGPAEIKLGEEKFYIAYLQDILATLYGEGI